MCSRYRGCAESASTYLLSTAQLCSAAQDRQAEYMSGILMFGASFHSSWFAATQCPDVPLICLLHQACWSRCWTAAAAMTSARRAGGSGSWTRCWPCCAARCFQPHPPLTCRLTAGRLCHRLVISSSQTHDSLLLRITLQPAAIVTCCLHAGRLHYLFAIRNWRSDTSNRSVPLHSRRSASSSSATRSTPAAWLKMHSTGRPVGRPSTAAAPAAAAALTTTTSAAAHSTATGARR